MIALTPRQHDALAAYCRTGDLMAAALSIHVSYQTMKNYVSQVILRSDGAISSIGALYARGWITIPARPGVIPARVFRGFAARSGTEPGGRIEDVPEPFVTERVEET